MRNGLSAVLLAAGVAGCAGTAQEKEQPPKDAFPSFTAEWRSQGGQPVASVSPALTGTAAEQKEFEDWRAWQEWKRKNPK